MNTTMTMNAGYQTTAHAGNYTLDNAYATAVANAKFIAMLLVAPLLGLIAVTVGPLVGLAALLRMAIQALPKRAKDVVLFLAAPFIGLAYLIAFPFIGIGTLAWVGVKAAKER